MMPVQLLRARRRNPKARGYQPKPLVEQLQYLSANDLARLKMFPINWHTRNQYPYITLRWPFLARLTVTAASVEATDTKGYNHVIAVRWVRTGFGGKQRPRPLLLCNHCSRPLLDSTATPAALPVVSAVALLTPAGSATAAPAQPSKHNACIPWSS